MGEGGRENEKRYVSFELAGCETKTRQIGRAERERGEGRGGGKGEGNAEGSKQ